MIKLLMLLTLTLTVFNCSSDDNATTPELPEPTENSVTVLFTNATDANVMATVTADEDTFTVAENDINISNDPKAFVNGETTYLLSRDWTSASIIAINENMVTLEEALPKSNPHDLSFKETTFYATMYNDGLIYEINATTLKVIDSVIIPMPLDSANPAPSGSAIIGANLYVAQQFQKDWTPTRNGQILVINTTSNTISDSINLPLKNPNSDIIVSSNGSTMYVICAGVYNMATYAFEGGGLVKIDIATKTATVVEGLTTTPSGSLEIDAVDNLYYTSGPWGSEKVMKLANGIETALNTSNINGATSLKVEDEALFVGYKNFDGSKNSISMLDLDGTVIYTDSSFTLPVYDFVR